ncbi:MAG: prefoldin subunit alpha [Nanoarchaeota archaeon]|nr:prefoldin subunit alpha [Nanoarchaeota archaeon]
MNEEKQQEMIFKFSMFEQQIQQIQQQLQAIEQGILEMTSLSIGLDELVNAKGKEILSPIGRGIFVKALVNSEDLTVDIGGKIFVKKNIPETKKIINEQIKKLEEIKEELNNSSENIKKDLTKLVEEIQKED